MKLQFGITAKVAALAVILVLVAGSTVGYLGYRQYRDHVFRTAVDEGQAGHEADLAEMREQVILATGVVLLVSVVIAVVLARLLIRPLVQITTAADDVSRGSPAQDLPVARRDEIGLLARAFESMATRIRERSSGLETERARVQDILESAPDAMIGSNASGVIILANAPSRAMFGYTTEELIGSPVELLMPEQVRSQHARHVRDFFSSPAARPMGVGLVLHAQDKDGREFPVEISLSPVEWPDGTITVSAIRDVTQERQREQELITAREQALSAAQTKSAFLAQMSHEIRTPMNAIVGVADLLRQTPLDSEQTRFVEMFQRAGHSLLTVINDILDVSKIEAGRLELRDVAFDLHVLAERLISMMATQATAKNLQLDWEIADDVPHFLQGDPNRLSQIILNLLSNAVKFTSEGSVSMTVRHDPENPHPASLWVSVADTGIGISEENLQSIFERFTQVDSTATRQYSGTGLGLTISKQLVELMDGRIWTESEIGVGTTFHFTMQLEAAPEGAAAEEVGSSLDPPMPSVPMPPIDPTTVTPLNILLADDSEDNCEIVVAYLKALPWQIDIARNGIQCVEMFKADRYDLVLMDIEMPEMDGYAAIREIRRWEDTTDARSRTPIIAFTAYALAEEGDKSRDAGSSLHLCKPVRQHELVAAIRDLTVPTADAQSNHIRTAMQEKADPLLRGKIPAYIERRRNDLQSIRDALESGDLAAVVTIGHKIKGHAAAYGMEELGEIGRALEVAANAKEAAEIESLREKMEQFLESLTLS